MRSRSVKWTPATALVLISMATNCPCGKHAMVIFEFLDRVRRLRGIDQLANLDDRLVIRAIQQTNAIISGKHRFVLNARGQ